MKQAIHVRPFKGQKGICLSYETCVFQKKMYQKLINLYNYYLKEGSQNLKVQKYGLWPSRGEGWVSHNQILVQI